MNENSFMLRNQELVDYFEAIQPDVNSLIKPKKINLLDIDGVDRNFTIHRIPALWCQAIVDAYIHASIPKMSSPVEKEAVTRCILRFVSIDVSGVKMNMDCCPSIADNHLGDGFDMLQQLIGEVIKHNSNFFPDGVPSPYEVVMERLTSGLLHAVGETISAS